jgi:hypothetical protein
MKTEAESTFRNAVIFNLHDGQNPNDNFTFAHDNKFHLRVPFPRTLISVTLELQQFNLKSRHSKETNSFKCLLKDYKSNFQRRKRHGKLTFGV